MVLSRRGSDFDLAAMFATRLLFLQMCCKLFLQRKSKKQSMCRSLDRYWEFGPERDPLSDFWSKSRAAHPRCRARPLRTRAMESMPSFRNLMSAYIHAFLEQVLVSVACNGAHGLKERLARWLLMMRDRSDYDALAITQSLLAEMLGVHRPTITQAVQELERAGVIEHGRRQVAIVDRQGLIEASCECYQLVRSRVAFHLPKTYT
jgi:hypothetical protein